VGWDRVKGHNGVLKRFQRAAQRGRLAHAYLFVGPEGVGKKLFAREFGKAVLCEQSGQEFAACDRCHSCILVEAGNHPDFLVESRPPEVQEFPVELMRSVCASFSLKSARGRGKVVVIDDADDLNEESANCFLKTLEEPPAQSYLILVGAARDRQLPTIVSRCQVVPFGPLPAPVIDDLLVKQGIEDRANRQAALRLAEGSVARALEAADSEVQVFRAGVMESLGQGKKDLADLAKFWWAFVEQGGKESAAQRRRAKLGLRIMVDFLHSAIHCAVDTTFEGYDESEIKVLRGLAAQAGVESLIQITERILEADYQVERRVQLVLVVEALLFDLDRLGAFATSSN
jgi:DNA polymerase-3 subunit delta'